MAVSFNKRELQKKKEQKKQEKLKRKEERKASASGSFDDMIAYVDENGMITDTPPIRIRNKKSRSRILKCQLLKKNSWKKFH